MAVKYSINNNTEVFLMPVEVSGAVVQDYVIELYDKQEMLLLEGTMFVEGSIHDVPVFKFTTLICKYTSVLSVFFNNLTEARLL